MARRGLCEYLDERGDEDLEHAAGCLALDSDLEVEADARRGVRAAVAARRVRAGRQILYCDDRPAFAGVDTCELFRVQFLLKLVVDRRIVEQRAGMFKI